MSAFGAVPGMTILTMASVILLGVAYLGTAALLSFSGEAQRAWRPVLVPVISLFAITTAFALISAILENQFITRITGN